MQVKSAPTSVAKQTGLVVGLVIAIVAFEIFAAHLFEPSTGGGLNFLRVLCAGLAGGVGAVVGRLIGKTIGRKSNRPNDSSL
jgi:hypothetical protein